MRSSTRTAPSSCAGSTTHGSARATGCARRPATRSGARSSRRGWSRRASTQPLREPSAVLRLLVLLVPVGLVEHLGQEREERLGQPLGAPGPPPPGERVVV